MTAGGAIDVVGETDEGSRLDQFCARRHPGVSRTRLTELIRAGQVLLDGRTARPSERLVRGSTITVMLPSAPEEHVLRAEPMPLAVLYEDDEVLVLDKPAGLVVHPGAGVAEATLAAGLLHHAPGLAGVGGEGRAGLVHRLDRGTTGVMVVAKTGASHRRLQDQFRGRSVEKVYHAIVWGRPRNEEGRIDLPVGRDPRSRVKMSTRAARGREAHSTYRTRGTAPGFAWLEVRILTGRTHQVRVHLAAVGHPVVGDTTYGGDRAATVADLAVRRAVRDVSRPLLHAFRLAFDHPASGARLTFDAPWPQDMQAAWSAMGGTLPSRCR